MDGYDDKGEGQDAKQSTPSGEDLGQQALPEAFLSAGDSNGMFERTDTPQIYLRYA